MRLLFAALVLTSALTGCGGNESTPADTESKDSTAAKTDSVATAPPADNTLTAAEQSEGWQLLFDGKTKDGWHVYNNKSDGAEWGVADGSLHLDPNAKKDQKKPTYGDLITNEEFENFDLKIDWKIDTAGNSGIIFYVAEDKKYPEDYHTGPEMQVLDNAKHPDAKFPKHHAGDLYDLIASSPETVKPALEWNSAEIISNKGSLKFFLNGQEVVNTTMWDDNWKKMLAGSKFKQWKDFGTFKKGKIAIQYHGAQVWYKNIKIKKL
jgi:hypothetical protein